MAVGTAQDRVSHAPGARFGRTRLTETKHALLTTEFWAMVGVIVGILVASAVVGDDDGGGDAFGARSAWLYVAIVAVGYMVSRGLAKSGSYEPRRDDVDDRR